MNCEIWKPIKRYEATYHVSNHGRIKSLEKRVNSKHGTRLRREKILKPTAGLGYMYVTLINKSKLVHRLVAEAFIDNPEGKKQVNHMDYNRSNNHISNLEWVSSSENNKHLCANGRMAKTNALRCSHRKLNEAQVIQIIDMLKNRKVGDIAKVARLFGVSRTNISSIINGKSWGYLNGNA